MTFRLWSYILKRHAAPFVFATVIVMVLFLLQFLMKMIDQLVGKGLGVWVITQLVALNLAWMLVLAVPMGALVAGLMAFGNLSSTNEVTAMRSSGVSTMRMILPALLAGLVVSYLVFRFDNDVLPDANHQARVLASDIQQKKPAFAIEAGRFFNEINGYSILAQKTHENSSLLEGITIYDHSQLGLMRIVTAERGTPAFTADSSKLVFELINGEIHQMDQRNLTEYRAVKFSRHQIAMSASGFTLMRTGDALQARGDREMNIAAMRGEVRRAEIMDSSERARLVQTVQDRVAAQFNAPPVTAPGTPTQLAINAFTPLRQQIESQLNVLDNAHRTQDSYLVEIYKKYSIPFACFVFILAGAPLGIIVKRGTFGVSAGISLAFFVLYWAFLIGGEKLADRNIVSPLLGMWAANIVVGGLGLLLILKLSLPNVRVGWRRRDRLNVAVK